MKECHNCPLNGAGSDECMRCAAEDRTQGRPYNHGRTVVSIEELGGDVEDVIELPGEENEVRVRYSESMRELMAMDTDLRDIVMHRMLGETHAEIAERRGCTRQAVSMRIARAVSKYGTIDRMFPDRHGCHRGGRDNA